MCFVSMKYSEIINVSSDFSDVYSVDDEKENEWKRYIITNEFTRTFEDVISSYSSNKRKSFWIQGTYGTGKSHTLAVFKHILSDDYEKITDFINRIDNSQLKNSALEFRKNNRIFPVVINGINGISDSLSMSQVIQSRVKDSLEKAGINVELNTDLEQIKTIVSNPKYDSFISDLLKNELYSFCDTKEELIGLLNNNDFEVFKIIERNLKKDGIVVTTTGKITDWLKEVSSQLTSKTNYTGLTIFWDEFTSILELQESRSLLVDIQEIARLTEHGVYVFIVTHKLYNAIEGYKNLIKEDQKKIEDRFFIEQYTIDAVTNYHILSNALNKINKSKLDELIEARVRGQINVIDSISKIVGNKSNSDEIKNQIINLYPFHPYVAFASTNLARIVGSAKRSVFQFINDSEHGFLNFINNSIDDEKFLTVERMWDFFLNKFKEEPKYSEVINTYVKYQEQVLDLDANGSVNNIYFKIFKCVLLLNILQSSIDVSDSFSSISLIRPTLESISIAYSGVYDVNDIQIVLDKFNELEIVTRNPSGDYTVVVSNIAPEKVKAEAKSVIKDNNDIPKVIGKYPSVITTFKNGLVEGIIRTSTIAFFPFVTDGLTAAIDSKFSDSKIANNVKFAVFLRRGFNDSANGFIDEVSVEEIKNAVVNYGKNHKNNIIFIICKDVEFGQRNFNNWLDAKSRAIISSRNGQVDDYQSYENSAEKWVNDYLNHITEARYDVVFKDGIVEKKYNDIGSFVNDDIVKSIIYKYGLENVEGLYSTVWKMSSKPKQAVIERMLQPTREEVYGVSRSGKLPSNLLPLMKKNNAELYDENMKLIDPNSDYCITKLVREITNVMEASKNETSIDLSEKLRFVFEPPYGFYNCDCCNAALALGLRQYINKIRLVNASTKVVNEATMKTIIVELFDNIIDDKTSNNLTVRFSTESEVKLMKNLAMLFGIQTNADSTLTTVKWDVRTSFDKNNKAPLWVLKYLTKNKKLQGVIDKLFDFTVSWDLDFTEEETKELSKLVDTNLIELQNIIQDIKSEDCFIKYLKQHEKNAGQNDSFISSENEYLKNKMKSENNFKLEDEVNQFIDEYFESIKPKETSDQDNSNSDIVKDEDGGGTIIPGLELKEKLERLDNIMNEKGLDDAVKDFIRKYLDVNPSNTDSILSFIDKNI